MARLRKDNHMYGNFEEVVVCPKAGDGSERRGACIQNPPRMVGYSKLTVMYVALSTNC